MKFEKTVVDSHMHVKILRDETGRDYFEFFDQVQKDHGLKGLNICSSGFYNGAANNIMTALYKMHNPTAYAYGSMIYTEAPIKYPMPEGMDFKSQYEELMEIGFDGIKSLEIKPTIQKKYGSIMSDEHYDVMFELCEKNNTHIVWHVGDPETFWDINRISPRHLAKGWYYGDGGYMPLEEIYAQVYKVLENHPKLTVTLAHFFFYSYQPEKLVDLFEKYENVGIDITPGAEMYGAFRENHEFYREFFIKYADRISYGTDTIFGGSKTNLLRLPNVYKFITSPDMIKVSEEECPGLDLPDEISEKILYKNFERVAGEKPKKINKEALERYIEKYRDNIKQEDVLEFIREKMQILK